MTEESLPADYLSRAKALKAKFFPRVPPPPPIRAIVVPGRVYGPHPIPARFSAAVAREFDDAMRAVSNRQDAKQIVIATAREHGMPLAWILGPRRNTCIVRARQEAMARVYDSCHGMSLPQIARLFNRDHTTVLHAVKKLGVWRGASK